MDIHIHIKKRPLYGFLVGLIVILGAFMVTAFGGSNPSILGHSAAELIVNSTSIVDSSIVNADVNAAAAIAGSKIDASSLTGTAAALNIGGNAATANSANSANTANTASVATNANACSNDAVCDMSTGSAGGSITTVGGNFIVGSQVQGIAWTALNSGNAIITGNGNLEVGRTTTSMILAANLFLMNSAGAPTAAAGKALCKQGSGITGLGAIGTCTTGVDGTGGCTCG